MFIVYQHCRANDEGDPAGYVIARDTIDELNSLDYILEGSECLWIVPGTYNE